MAEWPHEHIDQIFQQGLNSDDFPYNPTAWEQMEALLNRAEVRRKQRIRFTYALAGLAVLTLLLALWLTQSAKVPANPSEPQASQGAQLVPDTSSSTDYSTPEQKQGAYAGNTPSNPARSAETHPTSSSNISPNMPAPTSAVPTTRKTANKRSSSTPAISSNTPAPKGPLKTPPHTSKSPPPSTHHKPKSAIKPQLPGQAPSGSDSANFATVIPDNKLSIPILENAPLPAILHALNFNQRTYYSLPDTKMVFSLPRPTPNKSAKRFSLFTHIQPVFTGAGLLFEEDLSAGLGMGLGVSYALSEKMEWSIGGHWLNLRTQTEEEVFSAPEGFWKTAAELEEWEGQFSCIELPATLTIFFQTKSKKKFFATAGVSALFLLRESYEFSFEEGQVGDPEEYSSSQPLHYMPGYAHLAAGYILSLSPKATLRIAPYIHIPLSDIGIGALRLNRIGLGLQFSPF